MRRLVMPALDAVEEREVPAADRVAKHERADARRVRPEAEHHQIEHQLHMLGVIASPFADARRVAVNIDAPSEILDGLPRQRIFEHVRALTFGVELDSLLHRADGIKILVELLLVRLPQLALQTPGIFEHEIDDALIARSLGPTACGVRAEEAVEGELGIKLLGERRDGRAPGNVRAVKLRVAHVRVHASGGRLDTELQRWQRREISDVLRDDLIHRHRAAAQVAAGRARDRGAGEKAARLHVMSIARVARGVPQFSEHEQVVLVTGKRLKDGRQLELTAHSLRRPCVRIHAVGHVEHGEAHRVFAFTAGIGSGGGGERPHRFQHRETHHRAHALEHGAPGNLPGFHGHYFNEAWVVFLAPSRAVSPFSSTVPVRRY